MADPAEETWRIEVTDGETIDYYKCYVLSPDRKRWKVKATSPEGDPLIFFRTREGFDSYEDYADSREEALEKGKSCIGRAIDQSPRWRPTNRTLRASEDR